MRHNRKFQGSMPSALILLPTVTAVVLTLSACDLDTQGQETFSSDQAQYAAICTDLHDLGNPNDDERVDDDRCGDDDDDGNASNGGFSFVWIDLGSRNSQWVPTYGQTLPRNLGTNTHPRNAVVMKKLPSGTFSTTSIKSGAIKPASPVQRGGFGISSAGKGSGGG